MQDTSSDLSIKNQGYPEVEVLLATFNGEPFLGDFLESLSQQEGVKIHLRVSDDGSTDQTLDLIRAHQFRFESCEISSGPGRGPSANFFSLIDKASFDYVALADQDDIWERDKLSTQLSVLRSNTPHLVCHGRSIVTSRGLKVKNGNKKVKSLTLKNALIENIVFGNTILLNKKGVDLVRSHPSRTVLMHDSYIYLIFSCFGQMTFIQKPLIRYRIHDENFVGIPNMRAKIKNFRKNVDASYRQNQTFFSVYRNEITASDTDLFQKYFEIFESESILLRVLRTISVPIARQHYLQTMIWKILVFVYQSKRLDFIIFRRNSSM